MKSSCKFKLSLSLILILVTDFANAQEAKREKFQLIAKWDPATLFTPQTPTWQFGVELRFPNFSKHGLSVELDYGFRSGIFNYIYPATVLKHNDLDPKDIYDKHYSKYHFEVRKVLFSTRQKYFWYVAAEGFYVPYTFAERYWCYYNLEYLNEVAYANKDIRGGTLKFGFFVNVGSKLTFENFVGLGMREVNLVFTNEVHYPWIDGFDSYRTVDSLVGERTSLHAALGIKIGYRLF